MADLKLQVWIGQRPKRAFVVGWDVDEKDLDTIRAEAHTVLDLEIDFAIANANLTNEEE